MPTAPMIEVRRVVCPVDFSDTSQRALRHAAAIATWYEARLTVLHVHHIAFPTLAPGAGFGAAPLEAYALTPEHREALLRHLEAFVRPAAAGGAPVDLRIVENDVASGILSEAGTADLLVMGTHGRSGVDHLVLGSVTEKVLRKAVCPLLSIPSAAPADADPAPDLFRRILVGVDFSDVSMRALAYALSLAEEADAHLTLLHVIEVPPALALWVDQEGGAAYLRDLTTEAASRLRDAVPDDAREYCHVEERVATGQPYREILRAAGEVRAGLVVIGAHGRGLVERMFVGSTAQHVVRRAQIPVLTIRQPGSE